MENNQVDIKTKISNVIFKCNDLNIYSNIMKDLFTNGLFKSSPYLNSLNILPILSDKELKKNFINNITRIISFIKTGVKPPLDMYRVLSCIFGAFLGDALGAFCEFEKPDKNNSRNIFRYENTVIGGVQGQVTDDSEMALSMAYAIMDNPKKDELISDYLYFYYGAWYKTNPLDNGSTTKNAVKYFDFIKFHPSLDNFKSLEAKILNSNFNSLSNGFLMRKSPFIAWLYYRFYQEINNIFSKIDNNQEMLKLYEKIKHLSVADDKCTNPNEQVSVVSSIYCLMALMAINGLTANIIIDKICNLCNDPYFNDPNKDNENFVSKNIIDYVQLFKSQQFDFYNTFGNLKSKDCVYKHMGFYLHALKLTLYFLCQFDYIESKHPQKKYREIMNKICDLGGDTDTNCCIVGTVIGPLIGMDNFGGELKKMIELIPPDREIYSVPLVVLFVLYLKKSNRDEKYLQNDKYFLQQILMMLYGNIELSY